jgi:hypothetical protein
MPLLSRRCRSVWRLLITACAAALRPHDSVSSARGDHAWNGTRRLGRRSDGACSFGLDGVVTARAGFRLRDVDARNGAGAHRRIGDAGSGGSVARHDGAGADHVGEEAVGDDLVGGVGGVVRVPEHEVLAVGAELRRRQAQAAHRRVHLAARRARRLEPCTSRLQ